MTMMERQKEGYEVGRMIEHVECSDNSSVPRDDAV